MRKLTKRGRNGNLYTRRPEVTAEILRLSCLQENEFIQEIEFPTSPENANISYEALVYFLRDSIVGQKGELTNFLFGRISERVLAIAKNKWHYFGKENADDVCNDVLLSFFGKISPPDGNGWEFAEANFSDFFEGEFLTCWRSRKRILAKSNRTDSLDGFEHDGKAIADPNGEFDVSLEFSDLLDGVFDGLPEERKRAFALLEEGFPIESKHGEIATVSKMVGRSSRTIRNWVREAWEQYNDGARGRSL